MRRIISGIMLTMLILTTLTLTFDVRPVKAQGTIFIRADGSVDPSTAPVSTLDNVTYTLTGNVISSSDGIIVERDNIIIDGEQYTVQGPGTSMFDGIDLTGRSNVTVKNTVVSNFSHGIILSHTNKTTTSENDITDNYIGIYIGRYSIIVNNDTYTYLGHSSNDSISRNNISNNYYGIYLGYSSNNSISENNISNNYYGIDLIYASNSSITGNNITANRQNGIWLDTASNNSIYHNNFVNNTQQVDSYASTIVWDDGYPSGGNYWNDYIGTDYDQGSGQNISGSDGIGDTAYLIDVNNTDHYPLMGMFNSYNVTYFTPPFIPHACNVTVISNSTISDFAAPIWIEHPEVIFLMFNVSGAEGSMGFCRVSFPTAMMNGTYHVLLNGTEIPYSLLPCSDAMSYLYFNYTHSTQKVIIIPEFPSFLILPLFMIATLLAVVIYRKKAD
jgi:parallel beta-helix repeat protein